MSSPLSQRARRSLLGILAVLVLAVGGRVIFSFLGGSGATDGPVPRHVGRYSMLALGDSYTIGQSIDPARCWPVQLAQRLRTLGLDVTDPDILARTGWTTDDLLNAMQRTNLATRPSSGNSASTHSAPTYDEVLLLVGVNNQFQGQPLDVYRVQFHALLQRAVQLARGDPHRVIVLSIPDYGVTPFGQRGNPARIAAELAQYNASAQTLATDAGAAFVNITPASEHAATQPALLAADGLHPSALQYAQWVELTLPAARAGLLPPAASQP